jgi:hypothetical protein
MILCQLKPFNNRLGDTFQSKIGNILLYCEQISIDPIIYNFLIIGNGYRAYGSLEMIMNIYFNSTTVKTIGSYKIEFNDGTKHHLIVPHITIHGTGLGERTLMITENLYIYDEVLNLFKFRKKIIFQ